MKEKARLPFSLIIVHRDTCSHGSNDAHILWLSLLSSQILCFCRYHSVHLKRERSIVGQDRNIGLQLMNLIRNHSTPRRTLVKLT